MLRNQAPSLKKIIYFAIKYAIHNKGLRLQGLQTDPRYVNSELYRYMCNTPPHCTHLTVLVFT